MRGACIDDRADELLYDDQHAQGTRAAAPGLERLPLMGEQPSPESADDIALEMIDVADFLPQLRAQVETRVGNRLGEGGVDIVMP